MTNQEYSPQACRALNPMAIQAAGDGGNRGDREHGRGRPPRGTQVAPDLELRLGITLPIPW